MKKIICILLISILALTGSNAQQNSESNQKNNEKYVDGNILDFYCKYSSFTDPGEYEYLYENLPDSLPELCSLIKSQFFHLYEDRPKYRNEIPQERWREFVTYPTVKSILEGLLLYNSSGLVDDRKPKEKLVLGCRQYAILLASILKYRDIPARLRYGHATYIFPDFHISHVICEVWNDKGKRWMLVDPSMDMVDFSRDKFDFSNEAWFQMQNKEIDPNTFGIPRRYTGTVSIVSKVCSDLASILGTEYSIFQYAPILDYAFESDNQLTSEHVEILNRVSELMKSLDAESLSKLKEIYNNNPEIQITKTFASKVKK